MTARYRTIRALQDDVEDGLWAEVKEAGDIYRDSVKDAGADPTAIDPARKGFLEDLNDHLLTDYGYPLIASGGLQAITEPSPATT